ncbi:MAG: NAD(P)-dependent oxidoreductase [Planctomycetota bacterium]|nr:MAG: NAD(P)-dependent oxidoreductase [Planctomycetota bacterium]
MSDYPRIAVLGLGIIGSIWARNWHQDSYPIRSWNRSPKAESPGWCEDLAEAVRDADLIALVLADGPVTRQIIDAILPHLNAHTIIAQHATIGVDETKDLAQRVRSAGHRYLDMPFTGSKPAAEQRQTVFFIGDDDSCFAQVEAAYSAISNARIPLGSVGKAAAIKLAMNLTIAATYQAMAESLSLARAAGISDEDYWAVLDRNVARSGLVDLKRDKMASHDWSPQFSIKHLHKDLDLALRLARDVDRELPQTHRLCQSYAQRLAAGDGDLDFAAMLRAADPSNRS